MCASMPPTAKSTAPITPTNVRKSDVTQRGCRPANHTKAFFSTRLRMEVCILSDFSCPILFFPICQVKRNARPYHSARGDSEVGSIGGKTGIRTLGTVARSPHFECGPIDHSGIFPCSVGKVTTFFLIRMPKGQKSTGNNEIGLGM